MSINWFIDHSVVSINRFFYVVCILLCFSGYAVSKTYGDYSHDLDIHFRFDDSSDKEHRNQYRIRFYPSWNFGDEGAWSLNSFIVTGDSFGSSHNTLGEGESQRLYARRAYIRHTSSWGKTEIGVIPTYKGRISSSGLSKDGWISGIRQVLFFQDDSAVEVVMGKLEDTNPSNALSFEDSAEYYELEYSSKVGAQSSFELSVEKVMGAVSLEENIVTGPIRILLRSSN